MSAPAAPVAPDATLVIFGAMGDLARRLLAPALVNLARDGMVGKGLTILGVNHGEGSDDGLRDALDDFVQGKDGKPDPAWRKLRPRIYYMEGDFGAAETFERLATQLEKIGNSNVAFYLATAPTFFADIVESLAAKGLLDEAKGFRRVVIEKPFGHDLASAKVLNQRLLKVAGERQLYRIDHFLGKETVRNILVARFGNALLEAVWNSRYIDHVQITAAETVGVGTRGKFYDATGALRDMVPNHLFQLLAMIAMEPPNSFGAEPVRAEKARLIGAIRVPTAKEAETEGVRGQYRAGKAGGVALPDYRREADVAAGSRAETYVALKLSVDTWRWAGVPFYLRTGKGLSARDTEIVITFKPVPFALFRDTDVTRLPPNRLVLQIQPEEAISLDFLAKKPGPIVDTAPVSMDFRYADHFTLGQTTGYEALLYDVLIGDQSLFQRADEIESAWSVVQPFIDHWKKRKKPPEAYKAGTSGPAAADALIERDGRHWHTLG